LTKVLVRKPVVVVAEGIFSTSINNGLKGNYDRLVIGPMRDGRAKSKRGLVNVTFSLQTLLVGLP